MGSTRRPCHHLPSILECQMWTHITVQPMNRTINSSSSWTISTDTFTAVPMDGMAVMATTVSVTADKNPSHNLTLIHPLTVDACDHPSVGSNGHHPSSSSSPTSTSPPSTHAQQQQSSRVHHHNHGHHGPIRHGSRKSGTSPTSTLQQQQSRTGSNGASIYSALAAAAAARSGQQGLVSVPGQLPGVVLVGPNGTNTSPLPLSPVDSRVSDVDSHYSSTDEQQQLNNQYGSYFCGSSTKGRNGKGNSTSCKCYLL